MDVPIRKPPARTLIDSLKLQLSKRELKLRETAFSKCKRYVDNTPHIGLNPCKKSFFQDIQRREIRVDLEVQSGCAFVD